jgi:sugar lactone lactonase YvrE
MGDWWMSNQTMERALSFAGYDVRHVWGTGTHSDRHASLLFPDVMRWLWRDYPAAITARPPGNPVLEAVLRDESPWQPVATGCGASVFLSADAKGQLFAAQAGGPIPVSDAEPAQPCPHPGVAQPFAFSEGKRPVTAAAAGQILGKGLQVTGLTVRNNGDVIVTAKTRDGEGQLWRISSAGIPTQLDNGLEPLSGLAFSPDQLWLMAARAGSPLAYSYRVISRDRVDAREPFYYAASEPGDPQPTRAGAIWMDTEGRPYMATGLGVQIFDRNGRVTAILPLPNNAPVSGISFGGKDWKTLYAAGNGVIFKRTLKVAGVPPWMPPVQLPKWGAG